MTSNDTVLAVCGLTVKRRKEIVLNNVSFDVRAGDSLAILGPSGCGKSTLLRHVIGLERATEGSVELLGHQMVGTPDDELRECRLDLGVLFQNGALLSSLTVAENVALPLREHKKLDKREIPKRVEETLELVGLQHRRDSLPFRLSGGEAKRAGLARALALRPKVLFLDEPSAGLDPIAAAQLDSLIVGLRDGRGNTIVVVTHELESVKLIAKRIVMLKGGEKIAEGTFEELQRDSNPWIQQFLHRRPSTAPRPHPLLEEVHKGRKGAIDDQTVRTREGRTVPGG